MKCVLAISALAGLAVAMPPTYPAYKRALGDLTARAGSSNATSGPTDTQILQYALTLENLEKKFYADALGLFSASDFADAGFPDWVRGRYTQIAGHESEHVSLLAGALGNDAVQPCTYKFPYTDVKSFVGLATVIENVGVSAYAGAAQYISDKTYLTIAAVILSTEARHQAWQNSAVDLANPWGSAYDTPLGLDMVYTIASAFITSCPSSNAALPVKAFPALTLGTGMPGDTVQFTFKGMETTDVKYAIFYEGLGSKVVQLDSSNMAMIPSALQGISYVLVSSVNDVTKVTNDNILAGPAVMQYNFDAYVANPAFMG